MESAPGDLEQRAATSAHATLSEADSALLLCLRVWPGEPTPGRQPAGAARRREDETVRWLDPSWAACLGAAQPSAGAADEPEGAAMARAQLEQMHRATARVDLARVHPSWWIRALQEESPAVRRVVAAMAPAPISRQVSDGLLLEQADLARERPVCPEVLAWTLALWSERLVGGQPDRPDDPPAIAVLTRLPPRAGYLICHYAGIAKLALAGEKPAESLKPGLHQERWNWFGDHLGAAGAEVLSQTRRDLASRASARVPTRHFRAWLGLVTLARLLAPCEPVRLRWALQHWPYTIAKQLRSLMPPRSKQSDALLRGELTILKTAWLRLDHEGRLPTSWAAPPEPSR
jgi:hypothetical protein